MRNKIKLEKIIRFFLFFLFSKIHLMEKKLDFIYFSNKSKNVKVNQKKLLYSSCFSSNNFISSTASKIIEKYFFEKKKKEMGKKVCYTSFCKKTKDAKEKKLDFIYSSNKSKDVKVNQKKLLYSSYFSSNNFISSFASDFIENYFFKKKTKEEVGGIYFWEKLEEELDLEELEWYEEKKYKKALKKYNKEEKYNEEEIEIKIIRLALSLFFKTKESDLKSEKIIRNFNFIGSPYYSISREKRPYLIFMCYNNGRIHFYIDSFSYRIKSIECLPVEFLYRFGYYVQKKIKEGKFIFGKRIFFKNSNASEEDLARIDHFLLRKILEIEPLGENSFIRLRLARVGSFSFSAIYKYINNYLLKIKKIDPNHRNFNSNYYKLCVNTIWGKIFFIENVGERETRNVTLETSEEENPERVKESFFSYGGYYNEWTISITFTRESNPEEEIRIDFDRRLNYKIKDVYWYPRSLKGKEKINAYSYSSELNSSCINDVKILREIDKYFYPLEFFSKYTNDIINNEEPYDYYDLRRSNKAIIVKNKDNIFNKNNDTLYHLFNFNNFNLEKEKNKKKIKLFVLRKKYKNIISKYKNMFEECINLSSVAIPDDFEKHFKNE